MTPASRKRSAARAGMCACGRAGLRENARPDRTVRVAGEERGVDPARILAITFTEKAATRNQERSSALRGEAEFANRSSGRGSPRSTVSAPASCARTRSPPVSRRISRCSIKPRRSHGADAAEQALDQLFQEQPVEMRRVLEALDPRRKTMAVNLTLRAVCSPVYEVMRVSGARELPSRESADVYSQVAALARGPRRSRHRQKRISHLSRSSVFANGPKRSLPCRLTRIDRALPLDQMSANLGPWVRTGGPSNRHRAEKHIAAATRDAVSRVMEPGVLNLLRTAVTQIDALYREQKRASSAVDFADLEEQRSGCSKGIRRSSATLRLDSIRCSWTSFRIRTPPVAPDESGAPQLFRSRRYQSVDLRISLRRAGRLRRVPAPLETSGGTIDDLRENHRSRSEILDAVSRMLDGQPGIEARRLIAASEFAPQTGEVVERIAGRGERGEEVEAALVDRASANSWIRASCDFPRRRGAGPHARRNGTVRARFRSPRHPVPGERRRTFLEAREVRDMLAFSPRW